MAVKTEPAEQLPVHCESARGETRASDEMQRAGRVKLKETRRRSVCVCVCECVFGERPSEGLQPSPSQFVPNVYVCVDPKQSKALLPHAADINKLLILYLLT